MSVDTEKKWCSWCRAYHPSTPNTEERLQQENARLRARVEALRVALEQIDCVADVDDDPAAVLAEAAKIARAALTEGADANV